MATTPISKDRPPLIPVQDNLRTNQSPLYSKTDNAFLVDSTPMKRGREELQYRPTAKPLPRNAGCNYETSTAHDDRDEQGHSQRKKAKGVNSKKRVSFGGNSVKIITEHGDGRSTVSKPAIQLSPRIPGVDQLQTPPLSHRSPIMLPGVNDDSDMDTLSPTRAPSRISDSPSRLPSPSPSRNSARSPLPQRLSMAERAGDRQSFGLFYDEDVTVAGRGIQIDNTEEDTTQPLPSLGPSLIEGEEEEPVDGDITYALGYGYHDLINQARYDDEQLAITNQKQTSPKGSSIVPEQRNLLRDYAMTEGSGRSSRKHTSVAAESDRSISEQETQSNEMQKNASSADERAAAETEPVQYLEGEKSGEDDELQKLSEKEGDDAGLSEDLVPSERTRSDGGRRRNASVNEGENHAAEEVEPLASTEQSKHVSKPRGILKELAVESPELPPALVDVPHAPSRPAMAEYEELLDSEMPSVTPSNSGTKGETTNQEDFSLDELLRRLDVRFDNPTRAAYRDGSIAPTDSIPAKFDPSSPEFAIYESGKEQYYLQRLHMEKLRLQNEISLEHESIKSLEEEIRVIRPPMVQMLTDYKDLSTKRGTDFQCVVRRLRKTSAFQAKEKWVESRREWEGIICEQLTKCAEVLEKDTASCQSHLAHVHSLCSKLGEADQCQGPEKSAEDSDKSRRVLIRDMSFIKGLREFIATQELEKSGLLKKLAVIEPMEIKLSNERDELKHIESEPHALEERIAEKREEFSTIASVTGIRITEISANLISLTLCELADLNFSLHEDRIINTTCKPIKLFGRGEKVNFQILVDDVVKVFGAAASVKGIKFVRDIPPMLRRCAYMLMKPQYFLEEACRYYMKHLGSLISSSVVEIEGIPHIRVHASGMFHSMSLRSHFDIVVSWTAAPSEDGENVQQEMVVEEIKRTVGQSPDDDAIRAAVQKGVRNNLCSIYDSFQAVLDLL